MTTGETILLAEDETLVRNLVAHALRTRGYTVVEACSGEEAIRIGQRHPEPIHLILTDMVMPGIRGDLAAQQLMTLRPEARVVFMSGYTDGLDELKVVPGTDATLLRKPFKICELEQVVRRALDFPRIPR